MGFAIPKDMSSKDKFEKHIMSLNNWLRRGVDPKHVIVKERRINFAMKDTY